jgi:magnesium transporter
MDVRLVTDAGAEAYPVEELEALLDRADGIVWVDIPYCDDEAVRVLSKVFEFHPRAVRDCVERNRVPKVHPYPDHVFVVLHNPELGQGGHVHYIELDQFIGPRYLVTVHGPVNPAVPAEVALRQTNSVLRRIESGRLRPGSSFDLSYAIVAVLTHEQEAFVEGLTTEVWRLEQQVTAGHMGDPERFLEDLFRVRHGLLAVRTISALSDAIYGRMTKLTRSVPRDALPLVEDIGDQFDRVRSLADSEKDYLQGVIEFYRTGTETKMTIAAERLAVIAVVTLPITALSSILGMNLIVNAHSDFPLLWVALSIMLVMSVALLTWAKRQGWW